MISLLKLISICSFDCSLPHSLGVLIRTPGTQFKILLFSQEYNLGY